ncbi:hypothetical protein [Thioalkalivibrio sp. ALE20]|uniref:hypothetical protein n=1 Tax=Thioalkalivibrio sp. ALE20 TaxID=545275 RepID=UPI0003AA811A|nr:hypothetical protein [Thioalkalivibrio sp. ALE20]
MGNVINLVPDAYYQRLRQFEDDRQLGSFLAALDAIAPVTTVDETAVATWARLADSVMSDEPLTEVLNWVAKYRFNFLDPPAEREESRPNESLEEGDSRICEVARMAAQVDLDRTVEMDQLRVRNPVYGRFPAILPFLRRSDAPWFEAISEPAKIIGAFIDNVYPEDTDSPEQPTVVGQFWLEKHVTEILLPWAIDQERYGQSSYSDEALSRIEAFVPLVSTVFDFHFEFVKPETWGDQFYPEKLVDALIHLPQGMFDRVLNSASWEALEADPEVSSDGRDQPGRDERAARAIIEIFELVSVLPVIRRERLVRENIPSSVRHHFEALNRIHCVPRMDWGVHKHWAFEALYGEGDEYTVPALVDHVGHLSSGNKFDKEDLSRSLGRVVRKLGRFDSSRGRARIGYGDCGYVGEALASAMEFVGVDRPDVNFVLLLGQDDTFGFGDAASIGSPELLEYGIEAHGMARERSAGFRLAINSAFEEGFVELGCALMAFYLPTQVFAYNDEADFDWSWLDAAIDWALRWDHNGRVMAAVKAAIQLFDVVADGDCSESGHRSRLAAFLSGRVSRLSLDKGELEELRREIGEEAEVRGARFLDEYVGYANLRWMDGKDVEELKGLVIFTVRARDEGHLVAGSPVPAMLLTHWFKFLESRLVRVYDGAVHEEVGSNPDRGFGVDGSVADRLSVLGGNGRRKAQLLEKIRDGLPPGLRDDELLDFLQRFRKLRNKAAHEETLPPGTFEEIYAELEHGRLREFVEGVLF